MPRSKRAALREARRHRRLDGPFPRKPGHCRNALLFQPQDPHASARRSPRTNRPSSETRRLPESYRRPSQFPRPSRAGGHASRPCRRIPREPIITTLALARDHFARKLIEAVIFRALSRRTRRIFAARGIRTTDYLFGLHQSGNLTEDYVLGVIARLREGVTEIY